MKQYSQESIPLPRLYCMVCVLLTVDLGRDLRPVLNVSREKNANISIPVGAKVFTTAFNLVTAKLARMTVFAISLLLKISFFKSTKFLSYDYLLMLPCKPNKLCTVFANLLFTVRNVSNCMESMAF